MKTFKEHIIDTTDVVEKKNVIDTYILDIGKIMKKENIDMDKFIMKVHDYYAEESEGKAKSKKEITADLKKLGVDSELLVDYISKGIDRKNR